MREKNIYYRGFTIRYYFGVSFIVLAPEHELVKKIVTKDQEKAIKNTKLKLKRRKN